MSVHHFQPRPQTFNFDEVVRLGSGRNIYASVIATFDQYGPVIEHVESLTSIMANKQPVVLQGEDVLARLAHGELSRLASVARKRRTC